MPCQDPCLLGPAGSTHHQDIAAQAMLDLHPTWISTSRATPDPRTTGIPATWLHWTPAPNWMHILPGFPPLNSPTPWPWAPELHWIHTPAGSPPLGLPAPQTLLDPLSIRIPAPRGWVSAQCETATSPRPLGFPPLKWS
jgi:hypothetical protein